MNRGEPGIDPYTRAVSDVYQDIAGEGSFIGKGIYDVDAFERALEARFPDNRILSHDLLEGCYARSGLLSDVQLYEEYPASYAADMSRRHRWIRGDWQIAGWLFSTVPGPAGRRLPNPLSVLSTWKIFDNLRRSLVPAALVGLLLLGWTVLGSPWLWTLVVLMVLALPSASGVLLELLRKPEGVPLRLHLSGTAGVAGRGAAQVLFTLACLPYEATVNLDAFLRTTWRVLVSQRRLLEWNASTAASAAPVGSMAIAPMIALATAAGLAVVANARLGIAAPILLLWLLSPAIAWAISRPVANREARLTPLQQRYLGVLRGVRRGRGPLAGAG
jgi:cyclic beta-1,2-glucan synthetase